MAEKTHHDHPFGKPISILRFTDSKKFIKENAELDKIFNHDEIKDRKVVILSLIGAFRGGKSFLLDYCLKYLYAHFPSINNPNKATTFVFEKDENWMGESDEPLSGFSWSAGTQRNTTGLIMWSDVFLHTIDTTGEKIAIFVMDTQGLFDTDSTPADNSRIFALGTLLSSIQVFNQKTMIQEDHLQYLQFATEFAQFNIKGKVQGRKAFQSLLFLVRDWENDEEFAFGLEGGQKYFEQQVLKSSKNQKAELKSVREYITNSFEKIECCLLPQPGKDVANRKAYDGCWSKMNSDFKVQLKNLIEYLLHPRKMVMKKVNSKDLTGKEMRIFIDKYFTLFESDEVPEIKTIFEMTVESNLNNLVEVCVGDYKLTIYRNSDLVTIETLWKIHKSCLERALKFFDDADKMGDETHYKKFREKLVEKIQAIYAEFKDRKINDIRCIEEAKQLQAELEKERKAREEAENDKKKAKMMLIQIQEKGESSVKIREQEVILQERIRKENERLEDMHKKSNDNLEFRKFLNKILRIGANVGVATLGGIFTAVSAVAGGVEGMANEASTEMPTAYSQARNNDNPILSSVPFAAMSALGSSIIAGARGGYEGGREAASETWSDVTRKLDEINTNDGTKENMNCEIM